MKFKYSTAVKIVAGAMILTAGCKKDFFEIKDKNGIEADIWNNEGAVNMLLNDTYDVAMPEFPYASASYPYVYASDEDGYSTSEAISRKVIGVNGVLAANDITYVATKYQTGSNRYFDIARCNTALANIDKGTLALQTRNLLKGQFYALRAMSYFDLVRLYGGVPLILEPQTVESPDVPRAKARDIFKSIVRDLDSAMVMLPPSWDDATGRGKITRGAAAALKGKALMYWASPQFNPTDNPAHPYVAARWDTAYAACKAAYTLCLADGYALLSNYSDIFLKEGKANNPEAIIVRSYSAKVAKRGHNIEAVSRPTSEGGQGASIFSPTWNLVRTYTMNDGTPVSQAGTAYSDQTFWKNRDPRFDATIAYNGGSFVLSGNTSRRQWSYTNAFGESTISRTGLYMKKFTDPSLPRAAVAYSNDFGGNGMDWIEMRLAEVMLNYAECANEVGNIAEAKDMVRQIRIRAKILQGTKDYGLDYATDKASMRTLIMNERMVELAFEGKRGHDLRRTRGYSLLNGQTINRVTWATKSDALKTFLETTNSLGVLNRDTVNINNRDSFNKFFTLTFPTVINTPVTFKAESYFYALPSTFFNSSPTLEQTIGWDNGTFDPL